LTANCPSDSALASTFDTNFVGASSLPTGWTTTAGSVSFNSNGANFVINKEGDAPTIQTSGYFFFGYCEVKMIAASGTGIVSSIVMESDDLDEVDWEFLGGDTTQTQTNYFGKGDTTSYDRAIFYPVSSPQTTQHSYAVNWTSSSLEWIIDGVVVRTLNYEDAENGSRFPQTPMRLRVGIWAGGDPSNGEGTIEWAGGLTNFGDAPFTMTVQSVNIVNYSPGSSYTYSDESGSWQSVKVSGGSGISGSGGGGSSSSDAAASSSTVSGSAAIHVSTASTISSSTGGASTASSAPAVILQSTLSSHTVTATGTTIATTTGVSTSPSISSHSTSYPYSPTTSFLPPHSYHLIPTNVHIIAEFN
jgi:hypothetical protein